MLWHLLSFGSLFTCNILVSACVQSLNSKIVLYHAIVATTPAQFVRPLSNLPLSFLSKIFAEITFYNRHLHSAICCPFENASAGNYYYGGVDDGGPGASKTFQWFCRKRKHFQLGAFHILPHSLEVGRGLGNC